MKRFLYFFVALLAIFIADCADEKPYLEGHIRRADDGIIVTCDPYNNGKLHSCVVYASSFQDELLVYDATEQEMILAPLGYFPLRIKAGPSTNSLATVISNDQKFPYFLALGRAEPALYVVRGFPSDNKKLKSFAPPLRHKIERRPYKIAAYDTGKVAIVLTSYPNDNEFSIASLDRESGEILRPEKYIKIEGKPSHIEIDSDRQVAVISNESSKQLFVLDLKNLEEVLAGSSKEQLSTIDIGMLSDRIYVSKRDLGYGEKRYAIVLNAEADELKLINIDDKKIEAGFKFGKEHPMSIYFPDNGSLACCNNKEKNWIAVAGVKGNLFYIRIKADGNSLKFESIDEATVELGSTKNMSLYQLHVRKIIGGKIISDPALGSVECKDNRQMFFISSYASDRLHPRTLTSVEVEAQGKCCEGDSNVSRLGIKHE